MKEKNKIKIVGILEKISASSLHRIRMPLDHLRGKTIKQGQDLLTIEVDYVEFIDTEKKVTEKLFELYDIIYFNWVLYNHIPELDIWSKKHNCKLIFDVDDAPPAFNHPVYGNNDIRDYIRTWLIKGAVVCDSVVVTNELLAAEFLKFNKFVQISPNFLPDSGQFEYKPRVRDKDKKITISISGSYSHFSDWQTLKGVLKKIGNDLEIQKKCKFLIAGYDEKSPMWKTIKSWFEVNPKMEVETLPFEDTDNYMKLYDSIDILLAPLEDNLFNVAKSALKINEISRRDGIVIGSRLFTQKETSAILVADKAGDYYKWIKWLLVDDNLDKYSKELSLANRKVSNFDQRIKNIRLMFEFLISDEYAKIKEARKPDNLDIFGILYDSTTQYTEYLPYDNSHIRTKQQLSWRFEWNPIIDVIDNYVLSDYVGLFSYKMPFKTGLSSSLMYSLFREYEPENYDIITICQPLGLDYFKHSEISHPGLTKLLKKTCEKIGLPFCNSPRYTIYSNFVISKREIYKDFVNTIIKPALKVLEGELWEEANGDSNYLSGLNCDELFEKTGMSHYNFVTFILERMWSLYIENNNFKVKNVF